MKIFFIILIGLCIIPILSGIMTFYLFNGIVPLFWIPYVIIKILKKEYKLTALLPCLMPPLIWNLCLIAIIFLGIIFIPFHKLSLTEEMFWIIAIPIASGLSSLYGTVTNVFSEQARNEFKTVLEKSRI